MKFGDFVSSDAIRAQLGARLVVVTLGADGALMRGEVQASAEGAPASVVDTTGAGDVLLGVLVAALAGSGFDPGAAAQALPFAVATAARSTERYGVLDALPDSVKLPTEH